MKKYQKIFTFIIAISAVTAPVVFAIYLSFKQSLNSKTSEILLYAQDIQYRSDNTAQQVMNGIEKFNTLVGNPCDEKGMNLMRAIDLGSSYIQAIGYVLNNTIVCSSLGISGWKLGPIDEVTSRGITLRLNVKAPFDIKSTFLGIQKGDYIAIIHKKLPLDTTLFDKNISLGIFTLDQHKIIISQGNIKQKWINSLNDQPIITFFKDGYVVAIVKSKIFKTGAIAAEPFFYLNQHTKNTAFILIPIGLIAGIIFALVIWYWARQLMSLPTEIKAGLRRNEFFLLYQPIIEMQTGLCVGVEALIRWKQPNGEIINPDLFIPIAEYAQIIDQITERIFKLIAKDAHNIFKLCPNFHIAINVSAADLHSKHILTLLHTLINTLNASPKNFIIEATEGVLLKKEIAKKIIHEIQALGVQVALDDFGTGYSSLSYLGTFKFDYLKIDKSFINAIGTDAPISQVILPIINIARELKLKLIAEGIENTIQADFILKHGIQYAQGFLYGGPMRLNEIIREYRIG
jgi:sensor c-di-GMP phosphodiesterase-like protein